MKKLYNQKRWLCLFLIIRFYDFTLLAQSSSQRLPQIVPPSPNVAALQRFGDIPVSPYTGVPSISIPLYEIKTGNVSVPVTISYHASGIKVADEASRVGLGWALEAGGVISRMIVGADDFGNEFGDYNLSTTKPNVVNGLKDFTASAFLIQSDCDIAIANMPDLRKDLVDGYSYQPDVYSFNFLKYSGKFFLKRNREVVLSKKEKIKIRCMDAEAKSWEVTTDDGNKYLFEEYETYAENDYDLDLKSHKSAWYLTKIITQEGDAIAFQYLTKQNYIQPAGSLYESYNPNVYPTSSQNTNGTTAAYPSLKITSPGKKYKNVLLDKIIFKTGELRFEYSTDRVDVYNDVKLIGLKVYKPSPSPSLVKQWRFAYSYFEGTGTTAFTNPSDNISKRLKLDNVTELDALGNEIPPYKFNYNMVNTPNPAVLPLKTSYSRDHWGYFNGKNNYTLIPDYQPGNLPSQPVLSAIGIQGSNRDADPRYSQLFSLQEIIYPTGGKTVFEYESNDFDLSKSIVNDRSDFGSIPEAVQKVADKEYTNPRDNLPATADLPGKLMDLTDLYLFQGQTTAKVELTGFFRFQTNALPDRCNISQNLIKLSLVKEDGAVYGESYLTDYLGSTVKPMAICEGSPGQLIGVTFLQDYFLPPGKYYWRLNIAPGYTAVLDAKVKILYTGIKSKQPINYNGANLINASFGGGLRIKRITDYDNVSGLPQKIKRYEYHTIDENGNRYSNGRRMSRPMYSYFEDGWGSVSVSNVTNYYRFEHLMRESDSNIPLNESAGGNYVGYDKVSVLLGENGEFGKTTYEFENIPDIIWDYSEKGFLNAITSQVPRKPPVFAGYSNVTNGNIVKQTDYSYKNGLFTAVKQTENYYQELIDVSHAVWYGIEKRNWNGETKLFSCPLRAFIYPTIVEGRKLLTSSTTTIFDQNDAAKRNTQKIDYTYNNSTHLQLVSTIQTNSKGDEITTSSTYPLDYTDANSDAAILQMKGEKFMHGNPMMQSTSIKKAGTTTSLVTNAIINKYAASGLGASAGIILLKEIAALETTAGVAMPVYKPSANVYPAGFMPRIQFDKYNEVGNILQMRKTGDVIQSFIWGYNNSYPVTQAVNANSNEIFFDGLEEPGGWQNPVPVVWPNVIYDNNKSHSGNYAGKIVNPNSYEVYYHSAKWLQVQLAAPTKFKYSGWFYSAGPQVEILLFMKRAGETGYFSYVDVTPMDTKNKWVYVEKEYTVPADVVQLNIRVDNNGGGTIWFDDIRLHPSAAQMTTYTYDPLVGMTSACDVNNKTTYYEYDSFNRLSIVKDDDRNILKKICYNYAGQPETCSCINTAVNFQNTTTAVRCATVTNGANTGQQEQEQRDMNSCSPTFRQIRWINVGANTTACPVDVSPLWQPTGNIRCVVGTGNYNTGQQESEESDANPNSATYQQKRWVGIGGNPTACPATADWKITGNYRCVVDLNGQNAGNQAQEEKDNNPYSITYQQTRWTNIAGNSIACPVPVGCANCSQGFQKCINGTCEKGVKVVTGASYNKATNQCTTTFHYEWSDGSWSGNYNALTNGPCSNK